MTETTSRMGKIFRALYEQMVKDGTPEEKQGEISRTRFNRAAAKALKYRNEKRNTNADWATAQGMGLIIMHRPDPLSGIPQTFERAQVREDIWTNCGFILEEGEDLQSRVVATVEIVSSRKRKNAMILTERELI
ncbi:MAG: hypothetical protein LLG45_13175 [Actinomycetia bacterium]|nr:hypothetical protein [Actinomycetes bacterium]